VRDVETLQEFLAGARVDAEVFALREDTTAALFVLDALAPMTDEELFGAARDLDSHLTRLGPDVRAAHRVIGVAALTAAEAGRC